MTQLSELIERFNRQLEHAIREGVVEPTACALATAGADNRPSVRIVLLKDASERGFVFYTNVESRKGRELASNPHAALCFWWGPLHEQVRIEGAVERVSDAEADAYFAVRPRARQVGAWASNQSEPLPSRQALLDRAAAVDAQYPGKPIPRPACWSGFRLAPDCIEFWRGHTDRLHERLEYRLEFGVWRERILSP